MKNSKICAVFILMVFCLAWGGVCAAEVFSGDIQRGTLNNWKVGDEVVIEKLVNDIGNPPQKPSFGHYQYFDDGFEMIIAEDKGKMVLYGIVIYKENFKDGDNTFSGFAGNISPSFDVINRIEKVVSVFGDPQIMHGDVWGMTDLVYQMPFGKTQFAFDSSGELQLVEMTMVSK